MSDERVAEDRLLPPPKKPTSSTGRNTASWILTIVIAVAATLVIKTWVMQAYSIPSASMVPTLEIGDRVVVSKLNRDPGRGDIVVFNRPENDPPQSSDDPKVLIKRVIGLPGDTVDAKDGFVRIDGKRLEENYLPAGTSTTDFEQPIKVGPGQILVLGDNRSVSKDGRSFGTISKNLIVGRAVFRIWPVSRFGTL